MKEKHPIDELFQTKLEKHGTKPSDKVWEKINSEVHPKSNRFGGWFALRAASVSLLIGLSGWLYFYSPDFSSHNNDPQKKEQSKEVVSKKEQTDSSTESVKTPKENPKSTPETIQIIRPVKPHKSNRYIVSNELPVVDETELETDFPLFENTSLILDEKVGQSPTNKFRIKLKYNTASTTERIFDQEQKIDELSEPPLKERLFAYASNQFNNLVNGESVELPKTKKKAQIELNLDRLFNK